MWGRPLRHPGDGGVREAQEQPLAGGSVSSAQALASAAFWAYALAASIFHFDAHPVPETKRYLHEHGVAVRL